MRPVDKGDDLGEIRPYTDAQQHLIKKLGSYCSYCERYIACGIHIEHKKPKEEYPELKFSWNNFLLSCGNCNSEKGHGNLDLANFIWPDSDNTLRAFIYDNEGRVKIVSGFEDEVLEKIKKTWKLLGFNKHPDTFSNEHEPPSDKDYRWVTRRTQWQQASQWKQKLAANNIADIRDAIVELAKAGNFSIWHQVFIDDMEIKKRLIDSFMGTAKDCFDAEANLIHRKNGFI